LFLCTLLRRDRTYCTYRITLDLGIPSTGKQVLAFLEQSKPSHKFYCHIFTKFQVFFSSVLWMSGRRHFSAQVLFLFQFPWTFITNKLLAFNRIWIPSLYREKCCELIDTYIRYIPWIRSKSKMTVGYGTSHTNTKAIEYIQI
jgi:hypothetical protein